MQTLPVKKFFIGILLLASILRLMLLGVVPSGVTNDEASYIYSAYSIWHIQKDITGKFLPLSFNIDNSFSPVPIYLNAPFVGLLGLSAFSGRLLFAIAGIFSVVFVFLIARHVTKNNGIALVSMLVMAVNPWHLQFSRAAYDGGLALCFILLGTCIFLNRLEKGKCWYSLPAFFLGFYSYHATKIFLLFFPFVLLILLEKKLVHYKKELIIFFAGFLFFFVSYFAVSYINHDTRQKVFLWNDTDNKAANMVNWERQFNTAPNILKQVFSNKPLYYLRVIRENYFTVFSPQFLFLYGEPGGLAKIYGTLFRGAFYFVELPFLLLGIYFFLMYPKKKITLFIFFTILIAPLPTTFTIDQTYGMRAIMLLPFLSIVIGGGFYFAYNFLTKNYKKMVVPFFVLSAVVYSFFIAEYVYQYYFRYSVYGAESWFQSAKDVTTYIEENKSKYNQIILINSGDFLIQYLFYDKTNPTDAIIAYKQRFKKTIGKFSIVDGCIDTHGELFNPQKYLPKETLYIVPASCYIKNSPQPDDIVDKGEPLRLIWRIFSNPS